jgi:hypothetical protein
MSKPITSADVSAALDTLKQSQRGRMAVCGLDYFLSHAEGLDSENQRACILVIMAAFGPLAGTAPELVREAAEECGQIR